MRRKMITGRLLFLLAIFACWPSASSAGLFKVVQVYDGDTIKAVGHDIEIRVRLVGIDAPETSKAKHKPGQPFGRKAGKYLAGLVLNKTVDIKGYGSDRYGRILGEVFIENKNVNLEMIETGYAEVYSGQPPRGFYLDAYQTAEKTARHANRGIWSQGDNYISPRSWRRNQKLAKNDDK